MSLNAEKIQTIKVQSRRAVQLNIADLLFSDEITIFPEVIAKGYFSIQFLGKKLQLTAGPYVGLIPINSQITIDVRPKLPVSNLARIIDVTQRRLQVLGRARRRYIPADTSSESVLEFLTNSLVQEIKIIAVKGLHRAYAVKFENGSHPSGHLNVERTFRLNFAKGLDHRVNYSRYELTTDTSYNRLIKFALWFVGERLSRLKDRNGGLLNELAAALHQFEAIPLRDPVSDLMVVEADLLRNRVGLNRQYYEPALEIALAIVRGRSVSADERGALELPSYVINFETLFEDYLRRILYLSEDSEKFQVLDGNGAGQRALFDTSLEPKAQPDIVIASEGQVKIVIDVKYKEKVDRADINQIVTYGAVYRVKLVVLLHQAASKDEAGLRLHGSIGGLDVYCYAFDLGSGDLISDEARLVKDLKALIETSHKEHSVTITPTH